MNARTPLLLTILLAVLPVATPTSAAPLGGGEEHVYAMTTEAAVLVVEAHFTDGLATTKFAFMQLAGANGGPGERLKPAPECTEWIGTFTEAAAMLGAAEKVANATVRVRFHSGAAPLAASGVYENVPLDLEIFSSVPGGLTGSILTCDQPGDGLLRIRLQLTETLPDRFPPATVRVRLEG